MTDSPGILDVITLPENLDDLPDPAPFYHAVDRDNRFLVKKTMFGKALVTVKSIDHLTSGTKGMLWHDKVMPKLPAKLVSQVWSFFRHIHKTKGSESMVYVTYKDGEWRVFVPPQEASYVHVRAGWKLTNLEAGWLLACSIHSHCDFAGFHSGTDEADAREHEGLHLTIGDVDKQEPDVAAMVSISGALFDMKPEDIIDGQLDPFETHPTFWNHFVRGQVERPAIKTPKKGCYYGADKLPCGICGWCRQNGIAKQTTGSGSAPRTWESDDDYLDWALGSAHQTGGRYSTDRRYTRHSYSERSFFDLIELAVRNGDLAGDEADAFAWAVDMDQRLDDMTAEAESYGINVDLILRRIWSADKIGDPNSSEPEPEPETPRLLLGDGDDIDAILTQEYN